MTSKRGNTGKAMKIMKFVPLARSVSIAGALLGGLLGLFGAGCSSSEGLGNLLAGQACDAFTITTDPRCACCSERGGFCTSGLSECAPEDASPTCGNRCPEGLSCNKQPDGKSICGQKTECVGQRQQACGNCGAQNRTCEAGEWSRWSTCEDEGECAAGSSERCSGGSRTCDAQCSWGECEQCACDPGDTQECSGGEQQCNGNCQWGQCVQYACQTGETQEQACGNCGTQTLTCTANHTWSAGACQDEGECAAGDFQACGGGTYHECSAKCAWSACAAVTCTPGGSETEACGNCGSRSRECVRGEWTAFGACKNAGVCAPNDSQACGNGGTQTCNNACNWNACTGQKCDGSSVELCGNCGFHSRTCSNGTWSAYGACNGERDCLPGAEKACGAGMTQTCGLDCYWAACQ
jgi:hypothetical protein